MPSPRKNEHQDDFIQRCMSSEESKRSFPDSKQRVAFCHSQWKNKSKSNLHILEKASLIYADEKAGYPPNCNEGYYEKNGKCLPLEVEAKPKIVELPGGNRMIIADKEAGYPPNCNEGYYEKNGKCVPMDYTEGPTEAASEYKCPYDDLDTIWTGETKIILSRPFYVMRCPHGHETLSESPR